MTLDRSWAQVSRRLAEMMTFMGVDPDTQRDITQEVAEKVLASNLVFPTTEDLSRWAVTVARNAVIDRRRRATTIDLADIAEPVAPDDTERTVVARDELARVRRGLAQLSTRDQNVILRAVNGVVPTRL